MTDFSNQSASEVELRTIPGAGGSDWVRRRRAPKRDLADRSLRAERVIERVQAIPEGYVRTYGDIDPRAPRFVGRVLATTHDLPWHRVVRADGTIPQGEPQRELLRAEGVPMRGDRVDLDQARLPQEL